MPTTSATEFNAGSIAVALDGRIAYVIINRPEKRNAMRLSMWREMTEVFKWLDSEEKCRAIILSGSENNFSVGADVSEFSSVRADATQSNLYEEVVDSCTLAIASVRKPTIAAMQGYCLGGGCHLSLACDFRIAEASAVVGIPAARLSIVYGISSTRRLLNLVGLTNAKRILFSAKRFQAREVLQMGLIDNIHLSALEGAEEMAAEMIDNAPLSISGSKFILDGLSGSKDFADESAAKQLIDQASGSYDYGEAVAAFSERRVPVFSGR